MSQGNLELVTDAFRAATARPKPDFRTMNELFHPDHVFVGRGAEIGEDEARGARGYRDFLRRTSGLGGTDGVMLWEADLEGAVDVSSDKVLCVTVARYRGSASGIEIEQRTWVVATVRDGRVWRTEVYADPTEALRAVETGR